MTALPLLPATASGPPFVGAWPVNSVQCGDALALLRGLPDGSVDIVVTSPPYNLGSLNRRGSGMMRRNPRKIHHNFYSDGEDIPELEYQAWCQQVVRECLRVSKGLVWINHKTRFRDGVGIHPLSFLPFPLYSEVVWNRNGSIMFNSKRFAHSHEYIFGFGKPHYWDDAVNGNLTVWTISRVQVSEHACPYPEALIEPLIIASCPPGGIVLDPFMGSGTTALVATKLGRDYIGGEINPAYVELARRRLALPYTPDLFISAELAVKEA